jgi:putative ABC transport system substrate-binding protein
MKTLTTITGSLLVAMTLAACGSNSDSNANGDAKVCINEYVSLPIFEDGLKGLKSALADEGYVDGENISYDVRNPEGDAGTQQTIASQFLGDNSCTVIVGFATPGAQVFLQPNRKAPLVFFASSAPLESKLAKTLEAPGNNVTGVSDPLPVELELDAMRKINPSVKTVGLVWKNGDPSGDALAARAKKAADAAGVRVVEAPITNPSDTTQSARALVGKVDAIQVAGDGPTVSGVGGLLKVANDAKIPVFGGTTESVGQGALVAGVYDYGVLGEQAGKLVAKILEGGNAGEIPVFVPTESQMSVNRPVLDTFGFSVPDELDVEYTEGKP